MTNYEKMKAAYDKMDEIKGSTTDVARALKDGLDEEITKIKTDNMLSAQGKDKKIEEVRKKYGENFIKHAKEMRDEYDKSVITAKNRAEALLNEAPEKPIGSEDDATFNRKLETLKMNLLLATDPTTARERLDKFVDAQQNEYFAYKLQKEIPALVQSVLSIAGNDAPVHKTHLKKTVDKLNDKSMTDEQREAERIYSMVGDQFGKDLFLSGGVQLQAIQSAVGVDYARYANNPQDYRFTSDD